MKPRNSLHVLFLFLIAICATMATLRAEEPGKLIFADNFDRNESQEEKEEIGNGWGTNSNSRAGGNKQVDLRDGALHIYIHEAADHAVSVRHDAEFQNGTVELRFMLEHPQDRLGLDFADPKLKTVHAGHLFKVTVGTRKLEFNDMKTGAMHLPIRTARQAGQLTPEMQKILTATKKVLPQKLATGKWYDLAVKISGETITVTIDGQEAGAFTSAGFAHPTKRLLRLSVPRQAVIDDLKIYAADE